ncbi:MAG: hypothetical protein NW215_07385 [Hyphomicrobiales bacterium]|nr:hypothetical protein [Hyphomicrobiales bacterium]
MKVNIVAGLIASLGVLASLQAGTQWAAANAQYSGQLGTPFITIGRVSLYEPWHIFVWQVRFDAVAPEIFLEGGWIAAGGTQLKAQARPSSYCTASQIAGKAGAHLVSWSGL